ncbi:protein DETOXIFICATION 17-like [Quercus suber]|uniref:protein DETOXIFICATION 17-like n=1 Tax=Quercus suber TaxID=58331 RepID=UPI0032DF2ADA
MASALETLCAKHTGQTVHNVRHLLATFLDSFVLVFDFITSLVLVCNANTKAYGPNRCGGGAVGCGGSVVDSDAPEFPISVHVAELRVGIVGAALTLDFSWWVTVLGLFVNVVCGGCADSWTGFSGQAFVGLWDFFKLSVASGVMVAYVFPLSLYII